MLDYGPLHRLPHHPMKFIVALLLMTASVEGALAYAWPKILDAQDRCSVDDAAICSQTALWLLDTPFKRD